MHISIYIYTQTSVFLNLYHSKFLPHYHPLPRVFSTLSTPLPSITQGVSHTLVHAPQVPKPPDGRSATLVWNFVGLCQFMPKRFFFGM